jgi:hypothetical protein
MKIDYIIPYIDFNQPEIRQLFKDVAGEEITNKHNWTTIPLGDVVRLVLKNLPFINTLFITCKDIQKLPDDVNDMIESSNGKIRRVNESEFLPEGFITFSSGCITLFHWRIPGLSEYFIISNDDIVPVAPMNETMFFDNGKPTIHFYKETNSFNGLHDYITANTNALVFDKRKNFDDFKSCIKTAHTVKPLTISICRECYEKYENFIKGSLYIRRYFNNLNTDLYSLYGLKNNLIINKKLSYKFKWINIDSSKLHELDKLIRNNSYDLICFNDDIENIDVYNKVMSKLNVIIQNAIEGKCMVKAVVVPKIVRPTTISDWPVV